MKIQFRLILFVVLLLWTAGTLYECLIGFFNGLIYAYPFIHKTYSIVCHQDPNKLITISCGTSLVCARCLGIYLGLFFSSALFLFYIPKIKSGIKILIFATIPMLVDVIATSTNIYTYSRTIANLTGFLFGSILFLYLYNGLENLISEIQKR